MPGRPRGSFGFCAARCLRTDATAWRTASVQLRQDVEATNLVLHLAESRGNRLRIQLRTVGGNPLEARPAVGQGGLEPLEERLDILVSRVVVEHLVAQPLEGAVIDDRQDAEGAIVQLVGGDVPGEAVKGPIEVVGSDAIGRLFSPWPRSSSGW